VRNTTYGMQRVEGQFESGAQDRLTWNDHCLESLERIVDKNLFGPYDGHCRHQHRPARVHYD
jgi:hypothetical protein